MTALYFGTASYDPNLHTRNISHELGSSTSLNSPHACPSPNRNLVRSVPWGCRGGIVDVLAPQYGYRGIPSR
jgi:hypothetical protein